MPVAQSYDSLNVLINAASAHMGGAYTYLKNVLYWLPLIGRENRFVVYAPERTVARLNSQVEDPSIVLLPYPFARTGGVGRLYFDQILIPFLVRRHAIDVLVSATGFGSIWSPCPQVLLVRNLLYFFREYEKKCRQAGRTLTAYRLRRWWSIQSIRQADLVIFPTAAMRQMVAQFTALDKPTQVLHYGFDRMSFAAEDGGEPEVVACMRIWKKEGYRLLLNVSSYAVHKNFEVLIEALPYLRSQELKFKLVLTISRESTGDKVEYDRLWQRIRTLDLDEVVVQTGYVPHEQLSGLYQEADIFIFPSFTESFGQPMVEAMAAGLPMVVSDTPVNREVCAEAACFFRTFDPIHCAEIVATILQDEERRQQLSTQARSRREFFSWQSYTIQLVAALEEVKSCREK